MAPRKVMDKQFEEIRHVFETFTARLQAALHTSVANALTTVLQEQHNLHEAPGDLNQKICVSPQADNVFFHNEDGDVDPLKEIIGDPIFDVYEDTDKSFDECVDNNPTSDVVEKENDINFTNIQEMDPTLIDCVHVIGKFGMIDDTYLNVRNPLTYSNLASQSQFLNSDPPDRGHANFSLTNHHLEANSEPLDHVVATIKQIVMTVEIFKDEIYIAPYYFSSYITYDQC